MAHGSLLGRRGSRWERSLSRLTINCRGRGKPVATSPGEHRQGIEAGHHPIIMAGSQVASPGKKQRMNIPRNRRRIKGNRSLQDCGERNVRGDPLDDVEIEPHRRRDQARLQVEGHKDPEPDRVEAQTGYNGMKDGGKDEDDRHRGKKASGHQEEDVDHGT